MRGPLKGFSNFVRSGEVKNLIAMNNPTALFKAEAHLLSYLKKSIYGNHRLSTRFKVPSLFQSARILFTVASSA